MELEAEIEKFRDALKRFKAPPIHKEFISPVKLGSRTTRDRVSSFSGPPSPRSSISSSAFSTSDKNDDEDDLNEQQQQPDSTTSCTESPEEDSPSQSNIKNPASDSSTFGQLSLTSSPQKRSAPTEDSSGTSPDVRSSGGNDSPSPKRCRSMPPVFENTSDDGAVSASENGANHSGITTTSSVDSDVEKRTAEPSEERCKSVGPSPSSGAYSDFQKLSRPYATKDRFGPSPDPRIDDYFKMVAKTGKTQLEWPLIRPAFLWKLRAVLEDFYKSAPYPSVPQQNVEFIEGPKFIDRIVRLAEDRFTNGIPFTIQRLCELLMAPNAQYKKADKFFRAVEKTLNIVSTIDSEGKREIVPSLEKEDTEPMMDAEESNEALAVARDPEFLPQANFTEILDQSSSNAAKEGDRAPTENGMDDSMELSTSGADESTSQISEKSNADDATLPIIIAKRDDSNDPDEMDVSLPHDVSGENSENGAPPPLIGRKQSANQDEWMELDSPVHSPVKDVPPRLIKSPQKSATRQSTTPEKQKKEQESEAEQTTKSPIKMDAKERNHDEKLENIQEKIISKVADEVEGKGTVTEAGSSESAEKVSTEIERLMVYGHHDIRL